MQITYMRHQITFSFKQFQILTSHKTSQHLDYTIDVHAHTDVTFTSTLT